MWAKVIVSVTLLPMLIHSIFGCCWHHAHSDGNLNGVASTSESHCCHKHHASKPSDPVPPVPCEHDEPCDDMRCVYLAAEPARSQLVQDLHEHFATLDCCCSLILNVILPAPARTQQCKRVPLPSQHCALTQVWVV